MQHPAWTLVVIGRVIADADLGREAMDAALAGYRGRDRRYAFKHPYGALRAGPSLGWYAAGYDLCYDGWDEAYREKIAKAICEYNEGKYMSLEELVNGKRHFPESNHWGMQVGGGALALSRSSPAGRRPVSGTARTRA